MNRRVGPWDVAVVGAGPAGSMAAYEAARAGASVLVLERAALPRYKTCGGGLTSVSVATLPDDVQLPVEAAPRAAQFTLRGGRAVTHRLDKPLLRMVNRAAFDAELVRVACAAGATLRERALVRVVDPGGGPDGTTRLTLSDGDTVDAHAVVGADGTRGVVARSVSPQYRQVDVGLEVEVRTPARDRDRWADTLLIDWGPLPGSYGWVFPKGDVLTVGVIGARSDGAALRDYLGRFRASLGLDAADVVVSSGHLTRCRTDDSPLATASAVLAGDAAGLLEPWTREGISFALRSGRLAGVCAAELAALPVAGRAERAAGYDATVRGTLGAEVAAGSAYLAAFTRHPQLLHRIMATPLGWAVFRRVVSGETSFERLSRRRWLPPALRLLAR